MKTMGAHFSIEIEGRSNALPGGYFYESARAGLFSVLSAVAPRRVFVPHYICGAVRDACREANIAMISYSIEEGFEPPELPVTDQDLLIFVNYFGLLDWKVHEILQRFGKDSVIVDCAQAFFQTAYDCLATIYSPRKFVPVADGGIVSTQLALQVDMPDVEASIERAGYLLARVGAAPEHSRQQYLNAEASLEKITLRAMPPLTEALIRTADLDVIRQRRRANYATLSSAFSGVNEMDLAMVDQTPLCYPLMLTGGAEAKKRLIARRIFVPTYWGDATPSNPFELRLVKDTIFLPIDHRYDGDAMAWLVEQVQDAIAGHPI